MSSKQVVLIAFQEQPNLGVGYLISVLLKAHFKVTCLDFRFEQEHLLREIIGLQPILVGFSLIFQYHIEKFRDLMHFLRSNGVQCHFTAGGHNPSLRPFELLEYIPELDSIVLFEGEHTLVELAQTLSAGKSWFEIPGIAYRNADSFATSPLRKLEDDLDLFPPPFRPSLKEFALDKKYATLLAGRGCVYDCSFCSIRRFYQMPPGPLKRLRRPEMVVREIELLYNEMDCRVFMFQDDDFPVAKPGGPQWALTFCQHLSEKELSGKIMWKINCRPDEIDISLFRTMSECGLFLVYLGIESGTADGLEFMNKHTTVERTLQGVAVLKQLDILFDYGFMLFDPSTTFESIYHNLDFLEKLIADGSSPLGFGKMRPYVETKIEADLKAQGRLSGRYGFEDYAFLDEAIDSLYSIVVDIFSEWIGNHDGIMNLSKWVRYHLRVYKNFSGKTDAAEAIGADIATTIAQSNLFAINRIRETAFLLQQGIAESEIAEQLRESTSETYRHYQARLNDFIERIKSLPWHHEPAPVPSLYCS